MSLKETIVVIVMTQFVLCLITSGCSKSKSFPDNQDTPSESDRSRDTAPNNDLQNDSKVNIDSAEEQETETPTISSERDEKNTILDEANMQSDVDAPSDIKNDNDTDTNEHKEAEKPTDTKSGPETPQGTDTKKESKTDTQNPDSPSDTTNESEVDTLTETDTAFVTPDETDVDTNGCITDCPESYWREINGEPSCTCSAELQYGGTGYTRDPEYLDLSAEIYNSAENQLLYHLTLTYDIPGVDDEEESVTCITKQDISNVESYPNETNVTYILPDSPGPFDPFQCIHTVWGPINTERALDFVSGFISLRLIENQMEGVVYLNLSFEEQGQTWEMRVAGPFSASVP